MIIRVPRSLQPSAQRNIENFIRDIANVTQRGIHPFIRRKRKIRDCRKPYQNPFNPFTKLFDPDFICKDTFRRYMHIDLGQNRDAVGIAMSHVPYFVDREVWLENPNDKDKLKIEKVKVPVVKNDFWGRITVRKGEDIILGEIRELIYELARRHFYFGLITFDRFQSLDSIQILRTYGFKAGHLSIDRTAHWLQVDDNELGYTKKSTEGNYNAAQYTLRELIYDDRLHVPTSDNVGYDRDYFEDELSYAQEVGSTGKIDHPPGGTLDVEQAICGSAFHCVMNERMYYTTQAEQEFEQNQDQYYKNAQAQADKYLLSIDGDSISTDPRDIQDLRHSSHNNNPYL